MSLTEDPAIYHSHGGRRDNAGRKPVDGVTRTKMVQIWTTEATEQWFRVLAAKKGSTGAALEFLHKQNSNIIN